MFIPFDQIADESRIWIYQADRNLTVADQQTISTQLQDFCKQWAAHQVPLETSFKIFYDRFVILAVNENAHAPSGCSIDSSVAVVRSLEKELGINFFNRTEIAYLEEGTLKTQDMQMLKKGIATGSQHLDILIFNNLISTKEQLTTNWLVSLDRSWLARFIPVS